MTLSLANTNITYTAVAVANGTTLAHGFSYAWQFDDSTTGTGNTLVKQWSTPGLHNAIVTATDTSSGERAIASKEVSIVSDWIVSSSAIPAYTSLECGPFVFKLDDVNILIVGSHYSDPSIGNKCFLYNSKTQVLSQTGSLPSDRVVAWGSSICQMSDGRIFMDGAYGSGSADNPQFGTHRAFIYIPSTGTWFRVADRTYPNECGSMHTSIQMSNGKIYSGANQSTYGNKDEIYDPTNNTWMTTPTRPSTAYNGGSVCLLNNGNVFRGPGPYDGNKHCASYNPTTNSWSSIADCPYSNAIVVSLDGGKLLAVSLQGAIASSLYDVTSNTWSTTSTPPISSRVSTELFSLPGNRAILSNNATEMYIYDGNSNLWSTFLPTKTQHGYANVVALRNTWVIAGSYGGSTVIEYLG